VKLFTQMEEEARRLAGETACRSKDKVGGNQEIGDVGGVDFAGRAFVFEYGPSIGGEPDEAEGGGVEVRGGGAKVVERQVVFVEVKDLSQVKSGVRGVANGDDGVAVQGGGGDEIVMRRGGGFGCTEWTNINNCALKCSA
jgi:hypothetical protein